MKRLIDIGGYRLGFDGQGQRRPIVVLDVGLNATAESWSLVQAAFAATIAWGPDRATWIRNRALAVISRKICATF